MRSGTRLFAVRADEVEATSENLTPTPLPFAPAPVRGVVSQRGRILTVIDPLLLLQPDAVATTADAPADTPASSALLASHTPVVPIVVALRGDEQLALFVEAVEHGVELYDVEADADADAADASGSPLIRRILRHDARPVALLDPARLFEAAMRGVERRRQRT